MFLNDVVIISNKTSSVWSFQWNKLQMFVPSEFPEVLLLKDKTQMAKRKNQIKDKTCSKEICKTIKMSEKEANCGNYLHLHSISFKRYEKP